MAIGFTSFSKDATVYANWCRWGQKPSAFVFTYTSPMIKGLPLLFFSVFLFGSFMVFAADNAITAKSEATEEAPIELERILVALPTGLTYEQEVTLRIIRQGYKKKRSNREEDRDVWVCWINHGSKYLRCARNGDMWAHRSRFRSKYRTPEDEVFRDENGYGLILVTTFPADRRLLEQALASLPGSDAFDVEFIAMAAAGQRPPLEIPDDEEMDQFAAIWIEIGSIERHVKPGDTRLSVIDAADFSVSRYQHISELIGIYHSIKADLDKRVSKTTD